MGTMNMQASPFKSVVRNYKLIFFLLKTYVVGTQKNHLEDTDNFTLINCVMNEGTEKPLHSPCLISILTLWAHSFLTVRASLRPSEL